MNVLFLSLEFFDDIEERNMYSDLLREFIKRGHDVYAVSPLERRCKKETYMNKGNHYSVLRLKVGNIQKTNLIEKGWSTVTIEQKLINGIEKYFRGVSFNLILYATPPVTFARVVKHFKVRDNATTYLMLKDIFPQNAVDFKMMKKGGLIYRYFRNKEQQLYKLSDYIGCTSPKNIEYVLTHNDIQKNKVEISVNSMEPYGHLPNEQEIVKIREKYGIPVNKRVFLYGGNLGVPQGVDFLMKCLEATKDFKNTYFLIVGSGTEKARLASYIDEHKFENVRIMDYLPKEEFDKITSVCDIGLIFLSIHCTTPNTPCRLLSYTNAGIPVLAVTDKTTDVGKIVSDGKFGWYCYSDDVERYLDTINQIMAIPDLSQYKINSRNYLLDNYTSALACEGILKHFEVKR